MRKNENELLYLFLSFIASVLIAAILAFAGVIDEVQLMMIGLGITMSVGAYMIIKKP